MKEDADWNWIATGVHLDRIYTLYMCMFGAEVADLKHRLLTQKNMSQEDRVAAILTLGTIKEGFVALYAKANSLTPEWLTKEIF